MNKDKFLSILHVHLSVLPPEERDELLEDYEAHFAFGKQNGKSESDIARELGDPAELAKEAIGERNTHSEPLYWTKPTAGEIGFPTPRPHRPIFITIMIYIGLIFLNLVIVPTLFSFWVGGASIAISAVASLISPLALGLEYLVNGNVRLIQGYAVIILVGLGILLVILSRYIFKGLLKISRSYWKWNYQLIKGVDVSGQ